MAVRAWSTAQRRLCSPALTSSTWACDNSATLPNLLPCIKFRHRPSSRVSTTEYAGRDTRQPSTPDHELRWTGFGTQRVGDGADGAQAAYVDGCRCGRKDTTGVGSRRLREQRLSRRCVSDRVG